MSESERVCVSASVREGKCVWVSDRGVWWSERKRESQKNYVWKTREGKFVKRSCVALRERKRERERERGRETERTRENQRETERGSE